MKPALLSLMALFLCGGTLSVASQDEPVAKPPVVEKEDSENPSVEESDDEKERTPDDLDEQPPEYTPQQMEARALFGEALTDLEHGRGAQVLAGCQKALSLDPTYTPPCLLLGQLAFAAEEWREAEQWYTRALTQDEEDVDLVLTIAHCHLRLDEFGAASSLIEWAISMGHSSADLVEMQVQALMGADAHDEAEKLLRDWRTREPDHPDATRLLADFYEARKRYDDALPLVEGLCRARPRDASLCFRLAHLHLRDNRHADAANVLEDFVRLKPSEAGARRTLIQLYTGPFPNAERARIHQTLLDQTDDGADR